MGERTPEPAEIAHAIARARRTPPGEDAASEAVRAWVASVDSLEGALARAWSGGSPAVGPGSEQPSAPWSTEERVGIVPLRRGPRPYGVLVIALAADPGEGVLPALATIADAALIAQSRAAEARRRARHLAALAEFARAAVSASNVAEGVHALVRLAAQAVGVSHAAVYRVRQNGTLALDLSHGPSPSREPQARTLIESANEARRSDRALTGIGAERLPGPGGDGSSEISTWAFVPINAYGVGSGVLAAWDGPERHPASPEWERGDLETLVALADQAALLFEHARRLDELASVAAFVVRVLHELEPEDPRREYLEVVRREAERVDALLNEQLAYARLERPRLRLEVLNSVVQEALRGAAEALSRRRVRLVKKFAPDLPELLLDAERIRRVVANILTCALEAIPSGGRMRVETKRSGAFVVMDVVHDRVRQAGDALDQLFAPFGALPVSGAALGLGVAQQIVREHGGEIRVRAQDEWSSLFSVTLPVLENQDRRRRSDRRVPRGERRRGPSEA